VPLMPLPVIGGASEAPGGNANRNPSVYVGMGAIVCPLTRRD